MHLPKEGDKLTFYNCSNVLERPFMVYADFESSLIPRGESQTIHTHKSNSACCYCVCIFDSSIHKLYEYIDENCVIELLSTFKHCR